MQRILITGGGGFVAPYLAEAVATAFGGTADIILASRYETTGTDERYRSVALDVSDSRQVTERIAEIRPHYVAHLAGVSSLPGASADPDAAWRVNVHGTLSIARAMMQYTPDAMLLFAGSGQVYGDTAKSGRAMHEGDLLQPSSDYGVTKAAADLALGALAQRGLKAVRFRPFNHTGPGQTEEFVLPNFAAQIARIEAGLTEPTLKVGNLEAKRDFLDVRDVADAYASAMVAHDRLAPGEILNVASGEAYRIADLLDQLVHMSSAKISVINDPARMRPAEIAQFYGDPGRIAALIDWKPKRRITDLLEDLLADARNNVRLGLPRCSVPASGGLDR